MMDSYDYEKCEASLALRSKRSWKAELVGSVILTVWLTMWTFGCGAMMWSEPAWAVCFGMGLLVAWFLGVGAFVAMFGERTFRLDREGMAEEFRFWMRRKSRRVPAEEIQYFFAVIRGDSEGPDTYIVKAVTSGKPVDVPMIRNFKEARELAHEMNRRLAELRGLEEVPHSRGKKKVLAPWTLHPEQEVLEPVMVSWDARAEGVELPKGSRWKVNAEDGVVVFERRGERRYGDAGCLTVFVLPFCASFLWGRLAVCHDALGTHPGRAGISQRRLVGDVRHGVYTVRGDRNFSVSLVVFEFFLAISADAVECFARGGGVARGAVRPGKGKAVFTGGLPGDGD